MIELIAKSQARYPVYCAANRLGDSSVLGFLRDRLDATIVPQERSALSSAIGCVIRSDDIKEIIEEALFEGGLYDVEAVIQSLAENEVGGYIED